MNIIAALRSKRLFSALPPFKKLDTWGNWIVVLKAIFGLPMTSAEFEVFKRFTGRSVAPTRQVRAAYLVIGRRGGKSLMTALCAVWLAVFVKWPLGLEKGYIMVIAVDRRQASVVFNYVKRILEIPVFKGLVSSLLKEEIVLSNNMVISIQSASFRSTRGYQVCGCIIDESAFAYIEGASPIREIIASLLPSLGAMPGSMLLLPSTGFRREGPLYEATRKFYGVDDPDNLVVMAGTRDMNPTYSQEVIDRALADDYQAAAVEYGVDGQFFRADLEGFLSVEALDGVIVPGRLELPPMGRVEYIAGVDSSGGRGDAGVLSIAHREGERVVQDCVRAFFPPFNPQDCVKSWSATLKEYGVRAVTGDKYSASWIVAEFEKYGIEYKAAGFTKSEYYNELLPVIMRRGCELLDQKRQRVEFLQLLRRTGRGADTIDHPPNGGTDDHANACAISVVEAMKEEAGGAYCAAPRHNVYPGVDDYWDRSEPATYEEWRARVPKIGWGRR